MPALSKKQQKFFGIVRAIQKGEQAPTTPETAKAAADMKKSDVKKFASTKHKGLPEKKKVEEMYNDQGNDKDQKQIDAKQRRANQIKKQVLMKKIQAVRSGAGSEIMASNKLEGEVIEGYGNPNVGPALKVARLIDKTKPGPRSKRTKISQYLKRREMDADKKKYAAVGEELNQDDKPFVKDLVKKLRKGSKTHAKQADDLEKAVNEESNPRIPRKKGQPANSKKHSDLYTDENPKGTIHGLGFKDEATAKASVSKIRNSSRSHAHKIQAAVAMEQRAREMGKTSEAAIYRKYINSMKKKTKKMNEAVSAAQQAAIAINMKKKGKKPKDMNEGSLRNWFKGSKSKDGKGGWVNVVTGGTCASDEPGEGTPKCVSSAKRASMTKAERLSAARRKKKADPGQQQKTGAAKPTYVATDKPKKKMKEEIELNEVKDKKGKGSGTKDACYYKVKSRYSVWPSAYASGALVKCRKVGAANWGNSSKKEEFEPTGISFQQFSEKCWKGYEKKGMKTMFGKRYPNCVKKEEVEVEEMFGMRSSTSGRADRGDEVGRKERVKQAQAAKAKRAAVKDTPISQYQGSPSYQRMMAKMKKEQVERDEYGDPMGGPKISKKEVKKNLAKNEPDKQHTTDTSEGMAYGITKGSGKPSGQMAAFGKEKKKENPYSLKNKLKMVIKSVAEKERAKAGVTKEDVEIVNEISSRTLSNYIKKGTKDIAKRASDDESHSGPKYGKKMSRMDGVMKAADKLAKKADQNEEVIPEAKVDQGKDDNSKINTRNQRAFGNRRGSKGGGHTGDDMEARRYNTEKGRGVKMRGKKDKTPVNYHKRDRDKAVDELLGRMKKKEPTYLQKKGREVDIKRKIKSGYYEEVGVSSSVMMDKAKKEAMLRKKEQDAVAKKMKMRKESSNWRDEIELSEDDMKGMSVKSGHKRPTKSGAGMTKKGVEAYRRRNPGSKLKTAVTTPPSKLDPDSKSAKRRKSYCARSAGQMKKFPKAAKDPNSRLRQARKRWNC